MICVQISLVHSVLVLGQAGGVCVCFMCVCFPVKQRKAYGPPPSFPSLLHALPYTTLRLPHPRLYIWSIYLPISAICVFFFSFIHLAFAQNYKIQEDRIPCHIVTQYR